MSQRDLIHDIGQFDVTNNDLMNRSVLLRNGTKFFDAFPKNSIACCVTAYNEPGNMLLVTLAALIRNFQFLKDKSINSVSEVSSGCICVVIDGIEKMSESFASLSEQCGILDLKSVDKNSDLNIFGTNLDGAHIHKLLCQVIASDREDSWLDSNRALLLNEISDYEKMSAASKSFPVPVICYVKNQNAGKLDSHWHFFEFLAEQMNARYCAQIDISTIPSNNAFVEMLRSIEMTKDISAVSANVYIAKPNSMKNILHCWQCIDMLVERRVSLPMQKVTGYLSVLSGQMCLIRREALRDPVTGSIGAVLRSYYGGLKKDNILKASMYLTEDCLLGLELVTEPQRNWDINYAPLAEATTDHCEDLKELLAQRRRWILGNFSCKILFFYKIFRMVRYDLKRSLANKKALLIASPYFFVLALSQWFTLGMVICFSASLWMITREEAPESLKSLMSLSENWVLSAIAFSAIVQFFCCIGRMKSKLSVNLVKIAALFQAALFVLSLCGIIGVGLINSNMYVVSWGIVFQLVLFIFMVQFHSSKLYNFVSMIAPYTAFSAAITFFLNLFAICNTDDASWGTKGITHNGGINRKDTAKRIVFRWTVIFVVLSTNSAFVYLFISNGWLKHYEFILFFGIIELFSKFFAIWAHYFIMRMHRQKNDVLFSMGGVN